MSAPPRIAGTFSNFKLTKTRGVAVFEIEIPIEQADAALDALGGLPKPGAEQWVALAPIDLSAAKHETLCGSAASQGDDAALETAAVSSPAPDRKPLSLASKVALTCQQKSFHAFLRRLDLDRWDHVFVPRAAREPDIERAAGWVRVECSVESRGEIVHGSPAAECWHTLEAEYEIWQRDRSAAERHGRAA